MVLYENDFEIVEINLSSEVLLIAPQTNDDQFVFMGFWPDFLYANLSYMSWFQFLGV